MVRVQENRRAGQLPSEITGFVGRKAELSQLLKLIGGSRLVTVTGTGGVGKTRLALRAAAAASGRYEGVFLAELSDLRDPGLLERTVATALGLHERDTRSGLDAVLERVRNRPVLLVLDTCEHLIDECAEFAATVLARAAGVTLLATSRQPLDVPGEAVLPLAPLPVVADTPGDAVELFAQRAAAAVPGFTVTDGNRDDVARVCRRLGGVPLAIELAAVRLRALPLRDLSARLDRQFRVLDAARRGPAPDRLQSLHGAISWSYNLCSPAEQAVWARLSVFPGDFSIRAAEAIVAGDGITRDEATTAIIGLVDKSVVPRSDAGGTRYRLLDTIRDFGAARLAESPAASAVRDRHAAWYFQAARDFYRNLPSGDQLEDLARLRMEHPSIRAALAHTLSRVPPAGARAAAASGVPAQARWETDTGMSQDPETRLSPEEEDRLRREAASGAADLYAYWQISGRLSEGRHWLSRVLELFPEPGPERAGALIDSAFLGTLQGAPDAVAEAAEGTRLAESVGDPRLILRGYLARNLTLTTAGFYDEAFAAAAEAERRLEVLPSRSGLLLLDVQMGLLLTCVGQFTEAVERSLRGLERLSDHSGELWMRSYYHVTSGLALYHEGGREAECAAAAGKGLAAKFEIGDILGSAYALEVFAWLAADSGRGERAAWLMGAADTLWRQTGGRLAGNPILEQTHQRSVKRARESISGDRFDALFADGAGRPLSLIVSRVDADADALDGPARPGPGGSGGSVARPPAARSVTAGEASGPAALTRREKEIADLVSAGLSNREIAEQLIISRRTVDAHVDHIFTKLGISSRQDLAPCLRPNFRDATRDSRPGFTK